MQKSSTRPPCTGGGSRWPCTVLPKRSLAREQSGRLCAVMITAVVCHNRRSSSSFFTHTIGSRAAKWRPPTLQPGFTKSLCLRKPGPPPPPCDNNVGNFRSGITRGDTGCSLFGHSSLKYKRSMICIALHANGRHANTVRNMPIKLHMNPCQYRGYLVKEPNNFLCLSVSYGATKLARTHATK